MWEINHVYHFITVRHVKMIAEDTYQIVYKQGLKESFYRNEMQNVSETPSTND